MEYGHFNQDGSEYVILTSHTPRPWYNYIGNETFGLRIDQNGMGYSVSNPPNGNRITDAKSGRFIYLKDAESGDIWSLAYEPVHPRFDKYECRHSAGYTEFVSEIHDIHSEMLIFVPLKKDIECLKIRIRNDSSKKRNIEVFPYIQWNLIGYSIPWDDYKNYSHCYYNNKQQAIVGIVDDPLYPWKRHCGFMTSNLSPAGFECSKAEFIGESGDIRHPRAVLESKLSGKAASTEEFIAALQFNLELEPGEEKELAVVISYSLNNEEYIKNLKSNICLNKINDDLNEVKMYWKNKFKAVEVKSPDEHMDRLLNVWLKHQISQANIWCRGGDCRGYRDCLQEAMGIVSFDDAMSLKQIKRALKNQYADGFAPRQFSESGAPFDVRLYADSPVWIPMALTSYIKETGNFEMLNEKVPFLKSGMYAHNFEHAMDQVTEFISDIDKPSGTIIEHALKAMDFMWKHRGQHGLSLIFGGDWNDPLNYVGRKGRGESVWLSMVLVLALKETAELCRYMRRNEEADMLMKKSITIKNAINKYAWDGKWYLRAFNDDGVPIGTSVDTCGKIFILSQSWAVISGVADKDRAFCALNSMREYLDTPYGFMTMAPAYQKYEPKVGRISILRPGTYENASIYCHASTWSILADLMMGSSDEAYDTYLKISPYNPNHPAEKSFSEPYVFPNCYFGKDAGSQYGKSVMGWLTATSDWIYKVLVEWMIGIRPDYDSLIIDPRLPSSWNWVKITRKIRGCVYKIDIKRDNNIPHGSISVKCDGIESGRRVTYFNDSKEHEIKVIFN